MTTEIRDNLNAATLYLEYMCAHRAPPRIDPPDGCHCIITALATAADIHDWPWWHTVDHLKRYLQVEPGYDIVRWYNTTPTHTVIDTIRACARALTPNTDPSL